MSGVNKAVEFKLQMRQNSEDLQSFMKELESWEKDKKEKDEELRTGRVPEDLVCMSLDDLVENTVKDRWSTRVIHCLYYRKHSRLCETKITKQRRGKRERRRSLKMVAN